jgi:hypothetical protein
VCESYCHTTSSRRASHLLLTVQQGTLLLLAWMHSILRQPLEVFAPTPCSAGCFLVSPNNAAHTETL